MSVYPISGNQNYSKLENTVVTANAVYDALLQNQGPVGIQTRVGTTSVALGATGYYTVVDVNGNPMKFQEGDFILSTTLSGHGTLEPSEATFKVSLGSSSTGPPVVDLVGPEVVDAVVLGDPNVNDGITGTEQTVSGRVDDSSQWPIVVLYTDNVTSGAVDVRFSVIPLQL